MPSLDEIRARKAWSSGSRGEQAPFGQARPDYQPGSLDSLNRRAGRGHRQNAPGKAHSGLVGHSEKVPDVKKQAIDDPRRRGPSIMKISRSAFTNLHGSSGRFHKK